MRRTVSVFVLMSALVLALTGCLMVPFDTELSVAADFASRLDLLHHVERDIDFDDGEYRFIPLPHNPKVGYIVGRTRYDGHLEIIVHIGNHDHDYGERSFLSAPQEGGAFEYDAWILPRFGSTTQLTLFVARRTQTGLKFALFDKPWFDREDSGTHMEDFRDLRLEQALNTALGTSLTIEAVNVAYAMVDGNDGPEIGTQLQILARDTANAWREFFIPWDAARATSVARALDRGEAQPLDPSLVTVGQTAALTFPTNDIAYLHDPVSNASYAAYRTGTHSNAEWVTVTWNSSEAGSVPTALTGGYDGPIARIDPAGNIYSARRGSQTIIAPDGRVIETRDTKTLGMESVQLRGEGIRPLYSATWQYTNRSFVSGVYGDARTEPQRLADANYAPVVLPEYVRRGPAGGWIFHVQEIGGVTYYYEVAPESTEWNWVMWGPWGYPAVGTSASVGSGATNTNAILFQYGAPRQGTESCDPITGICETIGWVPEYAAWRADTLRYGGYDDWFLPSSGELALLYNLFEGGLGDFRLSEYWSSTEASDSPEYNALVYSFADNATLGFHKQAEPRARAIRRYAEGDTTGGTYAVGGVGPAGGVVFYDKGAVTDGWRYLEAAPVDQSGADPWGTDSGITVGTSTLVGTGADNSDAIVIAFGSPGTYAAIRCTDLVAGGYDDWFLPSLEELNLLYQQRVVIGDLAPDFYWSSSEQMPGNAWALDFNTGDQGGADKAVANLRVRAIRAF